MMMDASGACGDDNSSSSEGVGKLPLPSTTSSPVPSISSRGASWIDYFFGPEVSSSAPDDQGPRQQEEVVQPTRQASPSSSTGVGPQYPTLEQVRSRLSSFLSSFSRIKPKPSFIISTEEELGIAHASPEKLAKIDQTIGRLTNAPNKFGAKCQSTSDHGS